MQETKLAKVLKRIALLPDDAIPSEDQHHFKDRSTALAHKWMSEGGAASADTPKAAAEPTPDATPSAAPAQSENAPAEETSTANEEVKPSASAQSNGTAPAESTTSAPATNGDAEVKPEAFQGDSAAKVDTTAAPIADTPMES